MTDADVIGATPDDLASAPELIVELALSLHDRRVKLADAMLSLLGGYSREKVATLRHKVSEGAARLSRLGIDRNESFGDACDHARILTGSLAQLENAIWSLLVARYRTGMRLVPTAASEREVI